MGSRRAEGKNLSVGKSLKGRYDFYVNQGCIPSSHLCLAYSRCSNLVSLTEVKLVIC